MPTKDGIDYTRLSQIKRLPCLANNCPIMLASIRRDSCTMYIGVDWLCSYTNINVNYRPGLIRIDNVGIIPHFAQPLCYLQFIGVYAPCVLSQVLNGISWLKICGNNTRIAPKVAGVSELNTLSPL